MRVEAAWAASAAPRMRVLGPMPNAAAGLQLMVPAFDPTTALLPQAAAGPRTKKSSSALMQNQGAAKTARRRQLVDTGVAPQLSTSAAGFPEGLPGGLPGGHRRRTRVMGPTNDCSTVDQAGLERPVAARRRARGGARQRRHRHGQHGRRQPERQPGGAAAPACSCERAARERRPIGTPQLGFARLADSALLGAPRPAWEPERSRCRRRRRFQSGRLRHDCRHARRRGRGRGRSEGGGGGEEPGRRRAVVARYGLQSGGVPGRF